jgi:hypothetical protein
MTERTAPKVGDTIWVFDENRRVYARDEKGHSVGRPIWRECWRPVPIRGETKVSWVTDFGAKINKKSPGDRVAFSEADIDRAAYVEDARQNLRRRVEWCRDYETLKAIEALLDAYDAGRRP